MSSTLNSGGRRIYVELPISEEDKTSLSMHLAGDDIHFADPLALTESDKAAFLASQVAFGNCSPTWIPEASNLRWLQLPSVGFEPYASLDWGDSPLTVTTLHGLAAQAVAETCLAGILYFYRGLNRLRDFQPRKEWHKEAVRAEIATLSEKRVLIAGAGSISQKLRELLVPFACHVTLYGRTRSRADIDTLREFDAILPEADIVCSFLPETESTRQFFNASRIGRFKAGALFVNGGRGTVVEEEALFEAVEAGRLAGAVLDVTAEEPLPPDHKFWNASNILLTQHTAGGRRDEGSRLIDFFLKNWTNYLEGKPLLNQIDWKRGY